jgi:hypothetical protein
MRTKFCQSCPNIQKFEWGLSLQNVFRWFTGVGNIRPRLAMLRLRLVRQDPVAHRILNGPLSMVIQSGKPKFDTLVTLQDKEEFPV